MAYLVKCSPHKCEDLSWDTQKSYEKLGMGGWGWGGVIPGVFSDQDGKQREVDPWNLGM